MNSAKPKEDRDEVGTTESLQVCNELGEGSYGSGKRKRPGNDKRRRESGEGKPPKTRRIEEVDL